MARLVKTHLEWEGISHDELSVIEGKEPPVWKTNAGLKVVGRDLPKVDGIARVTGRAIYTYDVDLPGLLYARVLRSPHAHARIKRIDTQRARALPGVRAVVSSSDRPQISWFNGPLFSDTVRFFGDEIAAVAADDERIAQDALDLISVEYETLPFVLEGEAALKAGAAQVYPSGNLVGGQPRIFDRGSIKQGFKEAAVVVEQTFRTQSALHNCLETHGAVAAWTGDELTIWESTQSIYHVQESVAEAFDLPPHKVRVICEFMGGGFGSKQFSGKWAVIAAWLARLAKRPVKLMLDRREENLASGNRAPTVQHLKIGARRDGRLMAIELDATSGIGAYGRMSLSIEGPAKVMYACPNLHSEVRSSYTNTGPARSFRGPGFVEGMFPLESLLDDLADRLAIDPLELRLKNYVKHDLGTGRPYSAKHLDLCYRQGAKMIGWAAGRKNNPGTGVKRRGIGLASQTWGGGGGPPAFAWVRLEPDGSAKVITGSQDIGTGTRTVFAQIAAEELGLRPGQVSVELGDTARGPYDPVSWGSMSVSSVGPAVRQAAVDARNQLRRVSADFLDVTPAKIDIRDGKIYLRGQTAPRAKISDIFEEIANFTILGRGARGPNRQGFELRTFGVQFAEIEVDTLTAEVNVLRIVTVHDFGRVVNPLGAGNQAEGAVVQGLGFALTEGRVVDEASGLVLNPNLEDYLVPTALDCPPIDYAFIDRPDNRANSLGAKGLGEPAMIPTAPAVANALKNALGVRFLSLPIDRARIMAGLQAAGNSRIVQ